MRVLCHSCHVTVSSVNMQLERITAGRSLARRERLKFQSRVWSIGERPALPHPCPIEHRTY
jgi:hypothetical protein